MLLMDKRLHILLFFILSTLTFVHSQDVITYRQLPSKSKNTYKKASKYAKELQYEKAFNEIDKVLYQHPNFLSGKIKKAAWHNELKQYKKARSVFESIIEEYPDYNPKIYATLARMSEAESDYDKATQLYNQYLSHIDSTDKTFAEAQNALRRVAFVSHQKANPVPFTPIKLKGGINTAMNEYLAAFTVDGKSLVFTRRIGGQEDFFVSTLDDSLYSEAVPLRELNSPANEGAHTLSADGKTMYYTFCNTQYTYGSCDIIFSKQTEEGWSRPANPGMILNTAAWDAQPSLSTDGSTLYFSSTRKGGYGGSDIWYATKDTTGQWKAPVNAGPTINSKGNEESPFIHVDNHTLYFRSDGHQGMGKYDIFIARKSLYTGKWDTVRNIGYPINTEADEGALSVSMDGSWAYFASDKHTREFKPNLDIYKFQLPEDAKPLPVTYLEIEVVDHKSKEPVLAQVEIVNNLTKQVLFDGKVDEDGVSKHGILAKSNYYIRFTHKDYAYRSEYLSLDTLYKYKEPANLYVELQRMKPLKANTVHEPIVLKNIFFESGSAVLKDVSYLEINYLSDQLRKRPRMKIKIMGYTDNVGSTEDNLLLSENRAKAVYDALIESEIDQERLFYEGKGESSPIDTNDTADGRQNNRRTVFVILEE